MNETAAPDMTIIKFILVSLPINAGDMPPITTPVNIILDMSINSLDIASLYLSILCFNSFLSIPDVLHSLHRHAHQHPVDAEDGAEGHVERCVAGIGIDRDAAYAAILVRGDYHLHHGAVHRVEHV